MIPLMKVRMPGREILMPALEKTIYSGTVTEGQQVRDFEAKLQSAFELSVCPLTTNSCTSALQVAYRCAGVKDRLVLTTPMTCTATNMPILAENGRIVWCDINPQTGNISPEDVEDKILRYGAHNIGAIAFVDFAGYPAHLDKLVYISEQYEIPLVEDAAQSLGAKWNSKYIGNHADYTAYSFQAIKHLTTGDGGALINNTTTWELAKRLKWYGINREAAKEATRWHYDIPDWGYKAHMNNIAATIGLAQLDSIHMVIDQHKANGKWFDQELKDVEGLELLSIPSQSDPSYWIYMVKVEKRDEFAAMMIDAGIGVNVAHIRNDGYTCFKDPGCVVNIKDDLSGLTAFNDQYIALPCGWWVTNEDREYIKATIQQGWS